MSANEEGKNELVNEEGNDESGDEVDTDQYDAAMARVREREREKAEREANNVIDRAANADWERANHRKCKGTWH
jgi:hypothetical protein